jgi:cell division protein FtsL
MSIEQKIAELLAESRAQQLDETKVKPDGKEGGSNSAKEGAVAGDQTNPSKGNAVTPTDSGENPDNARNNVDSQDEAEGGTEKKSNPANSSAVDGEKSGASVKGTNAVKGMKEDMDALFTGEELSEEFKDKATTIFEAAVMVRVNQEVTRIEEEFAAKLEEATAQQIEGLVEQVDGYLGYIAEQWIAQNELALENGIKSEIVESFITGMKGLFEEHYIDVPEEKYDVLGEMEQTIASLESKLNEQVETNVALSKQVAETARAQIVAEAAEGLSAVETEKFQGLVEELTFETAEAFSTKVKTIRESYFTKQATEVKSVVTDTPVESLTEEKKIDPAMARYLSALTK